MQRLAMAGNAEDELREAAKVVPTKPPQEAEKTKGGTGSHGTGSHSIPTAPLNWCTYAVCYVILFVSHWFGARRFGGSESNHEDFDPEDVEKFYKDPQIITRNFQRSSSSLSSRSKDHKKMRRHGSTDSTGSEASSGSSLSSGSSDDSQRSSQDQSKGMLFNPLPRNVNPASPPRSDLADAGDGAPGEDFIGMPSMPPIPAVISGMVEQLDVQLDRNGDGQVDWRDLFESDCAAHAKCGARGEESAVMDAYRAGQAKPWFVLIQALLCFGGWLFFALKANLEEGGDFLTTPAGLISIDPELFDLRATVDCEDLRLQIWRWWTYQWSHVGFNHVLTNTVLLVLFGISLEGVHGSLRMFIMFNVGVFGGASANFVANVHQPIVGMSGGDYALLGMTLADLLVNWRFKKFRKPTLLIVFAVMAVDVALYAAQGEELDGVSQSTHLGGCVAGVLIGLCIGVSYSGTRWHRVLQVTGFVIGAVLVAFTLGWFFTTWPPQTLWDKEEDVHCWRRAVYNPSKGDADWSCVTCADEACIQHYTTTAEYIEDVSLEWCVENR